MEALKGVLCWLSLQGPLSCELLSQRLHGIWHLYTTRRYMAFVLNQSVYGSCIQPDGIWYWYSTRRYMIYVLNQTAYICHLYSTRRYMPFVFNQTVYGSCTQTDGIWHLDSTHRHHVNRARHTGPLI
jgi:hypothetical protein